VQIKLIEYLKERFKRKDNRLILKNVISTFTLFVSRYIMQFLQYFYLLSVLGISNWGLLSFGTTFVLYFDIVIEYGFNFPATRQVSVNTENKEFLTEIYNAIMFARLMFVVACAAVYFPIIFTFSIFSNYWQVYTIFFAMLIGYAITSGWFFQGMQKFTIITYNYIVSYLIYTICLVLFVHNSSDFVLASFFETLYIVMIGILNVAIITRKFGIKLKFPSMKSVKKQLSEGYLLFFQGIAVLVYNYSSTFILGLLTNNTIVGYYSSALVIITAASGFISTITSVVFPRISKMVNESKEKSLVFIKRYFIFMLALAIAMFLGLLFFSDLLRWFLKIIGSKTDFTQAILVIKIESILPVLIIIDNTMFQIMITYDYTKPLPKIYGAATALLILLNFVFVPTFLHVGAAIIAVAAELFIATIELIFLNKHGINIFSGMQKNIIDILENRKGESA